MDDFLIRALKQNLERTIIFYWLTTQWQIFFSWNWLKTSENWNFADSKQIVPIYQMSRVNTQLQNVQQKCNNRFMIVFLTNNCAKWVLIWHLLEGTLLKQTGHFCSNLTLNLVDICMCWMIGRARPILIRGMKCWKIVPMTQGRQNSFRNWYTILSWQNVATSGGRKRDLYCLKYLDRCSKVFCFSEVAAENVESRCNKRPYSALQLYLHWKIFSLPSWIIVQIL